MDVWFKWLESNATELEVYWYWLEIYFFFLVVWFIQCIHVAYITKGEVCESQSIGGDYVIQGVDGGWNL